jgi:hypothetical protein
MAKQSTSRILARLKVLMSEAGAKLYERIGLASQVMKDTDWIAKNFDGSDLKALDALGEYFTDVIGGTIHVGKLIAMYDRIPESAWEERKYNLPAVEDLFDAEETDQEPKARKRTSWKELAGNLQDQLDAISAKSRVQGMETDSLKKENDNLRGENEQLREEVATLKGRIVELERLVSKQFAGV